MRDVLNRLYKIIDSKSFFKFVILFFIFESGWIALSAAYPQAFDENFHFGLIKVYSHYWLPFLSKQPPNANAYGAVARDPSYLYHYLMSFPYRLINLFVQGQTGQVILLRFINIGLSAGGLILLRRILFKVGTSRALANICILLFILLPIVPQLAAQINYDNLMIPLIAWVILITFKVTDQLRAHKPSIVTFMNLLSLCIFTCLVKYAFLPIFLAVVIFLGVIAIYSYRHRLRELGKHLWKSWLLQSLRTRIILVAVLILAAGMFIQRDGVNIIKYHAIAPDCATVLSVEQCKPYSAWYYTYTSHMALNTLAQAGSVSPTNPLAFLMEWTYWMWYRLFFAVNGATSHFTNYPPLPLPAAAAIIIALIGGLSIVKWWRRIFHNNIYLVFLFIASVAYIFALILQAYSSYKYSGILQNMNGRYLLPVILLLAAVVGQAISLQLGKSYTAKIILSSLIVVLFLQGGGFLTFITRSDSTWYLPNPVVTKVNKTAQKIVNPVIVNGKEKYGTKLWFFN